MKFCNFVIIWTTIEAPHFILVGKFVIVQTCLAIYQVLPMYQLIFKAVSIYILFCSSTPMAVCLCWIAHYALLLKSAILLHLDKKTCITMLPVNGSTLKMLFMLTSVFSRLHSMKSVSIIETAFVQSFSDYMKSFVQVILSKTGTISRSFQND